jgi:hypothetical protein
MAGKKTKTKKAQIAPEDPPLTSEYMIRLAESKHNKRLRRLRNWRGPGPEKGPGGGFSTFFE